MVPGSALTAVLLALLVMPGDACGAADADLDEVACFHCVCRETDPGAMALRAPSSSSGWRGAGSRAWPLAGEGAWQRFSATLVPVVGGGAAVSAARLGVQRSRGHLGLLANGASCFLSELRTARSSASTAVAKVLPAPSAAAAQRSVPWRDRAPAGLLFSTVSGPSGRPEVAAASSRGPGTGDALYVPESDTPDLASVDPSGRGESEGRSFAIELYLPGLGLRRLSVGHVSVSLIAIGCLTAVLRRRFRA